MKISYNWLRDFVAFSQTPGELGNLLDQLGLEVENISEISADWSKVVAGKILTCKPVPDTDHLSHCTVDVGTDIDLSIVCGAPNVAAGQIVPVALVGAELPGGFKITRRKMRGVLSQGMICSERELGISDEASGIMTLTEECQAGNPLETYISQQDWVFELEITINRPDCLSHLGVAREIAAATGLPLTMPSVEISECKEKTSNWVSIEILAPEKCPRYTARIVKGVTVHTSPLWMQERLRSVGVRPISNVVDVTNYVMLELGHPLHAFDYHLIENSKIVVRTASDGEKFTTLDEKEHLLESTDLLIADSSKGIALAGVMGGLNSEIETDTRDVLIECAYFEPVGIRITSRDRGISSESSHRFERGVNPEMTIMAATRTAKLINELAGGDILKGTVDEYPQPWKPNRIKLRPHRANHLLATDITPEQAGNHLRNLGCEVNSAETLEVASPPWRHDLEREIDLIEEIARMNGYDQISSALSSSVPLEINSDRERDRRIVNQLKQALVELGFREAITLPLLPASEMERFPAENEPIKLENPLSEDMAILRYSLTPTLLKTVERNIRSGNHDLRLFEWGKIFWKEEKLFRESWHLSGVLTGVAAPEYWQRTPRLIDVFDLKGLVNQFAQKISLDKIEYIYYDISAFLLFCSRIVTVGDKLKHNIGVFGQVDPKIADRYGIDVPTWFFDFDGSSLLTRAGNLVNYRSLPRYPAAHRDLAFVVNEKIESGQLEVVIHHNGGELLQNVKMFDLFRGGAVPPGKKSLAYHLTFRSPLRTLSDDEIDMIVDRIIAEVHRTVGAELRTI